MKRSNQRRRATHQALSGRIAIAAIAVGGGLSASFFAISTAGAMVRHTTMSVVVSTVKYSKLGTILVSGKTLYTLQPSKTGCTAACHKIWPELTLPRGVSKATAGKGVNASKFGTVLRSNGVRQVTYSGKALYWFSGDKSTGKVSGNVTDTWGKWSDYVTVKPATSGTGGTGTTNAGTGGTAF